MNIIWNTVKKFISGKKGSYTVEAAMTLPVFILVFLAIALTVNIISQCEDIVFRECKTIHAMDMKAPQILPDPRGDNYKVVHFRYLYSDGEIDDLISISSLSTFEVNNPIGILGKIEFRMQVKSRGFTGRLEKSEGLNADEFTQKEPSEKVIVFPKYGYRFHKPGCRYVKQEYRGEEVKLTMEKHDAMLKGYTECSVCGG